MSKTVVGLFSSTAEAEKVKQTLVADGYSSQDIRVVAQNYGETGESGSTGLGGTATGYGSSSSTSAVANDAGYTDIGSGGGTGIGEKVSSFFRNLTGGDEHAHNHYATGVNQGGALLTATVPDEKAEFVASTLRQYGARDIEGGARQATGTAATGYNQSNLANTTGETAIPVVEEELVVGKREVDRGGVRIYSHVVERPVETDVTLHNERVNVERRPVNRPATAADFGTGEASFELRATGEEAVVGKTSRVVEEVLIGKEANERTEQVRDTVRKTEVEVEQIPGKVTEKNRY